MINQYYFMRRFLAFVAAVAACVTVSGQPVLNVRFDGLKDQRVVVRSSPIESVRSRSSKIDTL